MTWFRRFLDWLDRNAVWSPNFATSQAMRNYQRLRRSTEWGGLSYRPLIAAAQQDGARTTTRKRKGNIIVIIDLPQKNGPATRIRLKFKEKP